MTFRKVEREVLYQAVWAQPMIKVASEFGISSVVLKSICRKMEIPTPGSGYWRRREHGHNTKPPVLRKLSPQGVAFVHVTGKRESRAKLPLPEGIPDIDVIRRQLDEQSQVKEHVLTARLRTSLNAGKIDERQVIRPRAKRASFIAVSKGTAERAVDMLNALLVSLETTGQHARIDTTKVPVLRIRVEDEELGLSVTEKVSRKRHLSTKEEREIKRPWQIPRYDYSPSGLLTVELHGSVPYRTCMTWSDGKVKRLENRTAEIIQGALVAAKAQIQRRIDDEQARIARAESERRWREVEERRRHDVQRAKHLEELAAGWQKACQIRAFIVEVEARQRDFQDIDVQGYGVSEWIALAKTYADETDPLLNMAFWDINQQTPIWEI